MVGNNRRGGTTVSQCLWRRTPTPGCLSTCLSSSYDHFAQYESRRLEKAKPVFGVSGFCFWVTQWPAPTWTTSLAVGFGRVHDILFAWIQSHLGAYMFVNVVNITIPVSYDSILVRSLFFLKHKLQFSAKAEKTMPKWPTLQ